MTDTAPPSSVTGRAYPELTWTAVVVGWILGVIIAISIGYAALILGFSIEGSELAAILGFGILDRKITRRNVDNKYRRVMALTLSQQYRIHATQ